MTVYVTAVHLTGGERSEHIASVRWRATDNSTGQSTREAMVEFIDGGGVARVSDGQNDIAIGVVHATPPYIRTYADKVWTDNLLALPRF